MKNQILVKSLHVLFIAVLIAVLTVSVAPAQTVRADGITTTSDIKVRIVSMPKRVRACQTFKATFSVKNLGPDPASHLYIMVMLPDPFEVVVLKGAPTSLKVGQTVTFSADIKVVAFVPGEPRQAWIGINAMSDPYPDISIDPNPDNNPVTRNIRLVSDPVEACP
jgi:hypothetical protein